MNTDHMIFVFGSNTAGIHGAGAARTALEKYGAVYGVGYGMTGRSFAIPTKGSYLSRHHTKPNDLGYPVLRIGGTLSLYDIQPMVTGFLFFANSRRDLEFQVTRIGCGLAGLRDEDVAPMFMGAPPNCYFDTKWEGLIGPDRKYWGTF